MPVCERARLPAAPPPSQPGLGMTRKAALGLNVLHWRSWASRPAAQPAGPAALDGRIARAEKRAVAAEIIAKEANAIRLKALLDAAREQASAQTIRSAEERFAAAKGEWESVRWDIRPEPDPYATPDALEPPVWSAPSLAALAAWLPKPGPSLRGIMPPAGLSVASLVAGIGIAAYILSADGPADEREATASSSIQALDGPALAGSAAAEAASAGAMPPAAAGTARETASETAPAVRSAARVPSAASAKKPARKPAAVPPPPRSRPEREALAVGASAPVDQPRIVPAVE